LSADPVFGYWRVTEKTGFGYFVPLRFDFQLIFDSKQIENTSEILINKSIYDLT